MASVRCRVLIVPMPGTLPQLLHNAERLLTPEAVEFLAELHTRFESRRRELLHQRAIRFSMIQAGALPHFLDETRDIREVSWTVASAPSDLFERRVEVTGPPDRKTVINALNSGANVFVADFDDPHAPTWHNNVAGHCNLMDAVRRTITFPVPGGMQCRLEENTATLMMRPRGWHVTEKRVRVGDDPLSASLFDFGLFFFHNAWELVQRGSAPYFCLPKLESRLEARLWNDIFVYAQQRLHLPPGSIRATVSIDTVPAAFEMDEMLWELKEHSAGLSYGHCNYLFSFIKTLRHSPSFVLPDRSQLTMEQHLLKSCLDLLVKTCHRRGIHAIGCTSGQVPIRCQSYENARALENVRQDKLREVRAGSDGTRVAHPGLIPIARNVFDTHMFCPHQLCVSRDEVNVTAADLLRVPEGKITEEGLHQNTVVCLQYLASWLGGMGRVPLYNMLEDASSAELCRAQLWQWVKHHAKLPGGRIISRGMVQSLIDDELKHARDLHFAQAGDLLTELTRSPELSEFFTAAAYKYIN